MIYTKCTHVQVPQIVRRSQHMMMTRGCACRERHILTAIAPNAMLSHHGFHKGVARRCTLEKSCLALMTRVFVKCHELGSNVRMTLLCATLEHSWKDMTRALTPRFHQTHYCCKLMFPTISLSANVLTLTRTFRSQLHVLLEMAVTPQT